MTRQEIEQQYNVVNGVIRSPGKFEGEMAYLPIYFEVFMDGFAEEIEGGVLSCEVSAEDKIEFPELKRRKRVRFVVDEQGFVYEV